MKKITILKTMLLAVILAVSTGSAWAAGGDVVYKLNTKVTKIATTTSYANYGPVACTSDDVNSTVSTAQWKVTLGSMQTAGLWLGSNSAQKAKMILSNGNFSESAGIAAAIGKTTSNTYIAALISETYLPNIGKVTLTYTTPGGTAPSNAWICYLSDEDGATWKVAKEITSLSTAGTDFEFDKIASAKYAFVIYSTNYCQFKEPILTFYEGEASTPPTGETPPALTATSATVDNAIKITYPKDAAWEAVTGKVVKIDDTALTNDQYSFIAGGTDEPDTLQINQGVITDLSGYTKDFTISVEATDYDNATVEQTVTHGAKHHIAITQQPTAPTVNGDALGTQPIVNLVDQYGNPFKSTATNISATAIGEWTLGGTVNKNTSTATATPGIATFTDLTATSTTEVVGAKIKFHAAGLDASTDLLSDEFTIPAPVAVLDISAIEPTMTTACGTSVTQTFTVSGRNLYNGEVVEIMILDDDEYFTVNIDEITPTAGVIEETTVTITYAPTTAGVHEALYSITCTGFDDTNGDITGTSMLDAPVANEVEESSITHNSFTASWSAVTGAASYEVEVFKKIETQIVENGSFENWTSNKPNNWFGEKSNITASDVVEYTTSAQEGNSALQLINTSSSHKRFTSQATSVTAEQEYSITFWARGQGEIRTSLFDDRATGSGYATYNDYITVNSTTWTEYTQTVTAAETTNEAEFVFSVRNTVAANDHLQIDNVSIPKVSLTPITGSPFTVTEGTSKVIEGLEAETTYYYTVKAVSGDVKSEASNEIELTTLAAPAIVVTIDPTRPDLNILDFGSRKTASSRITEDITISGVNFTGDVTVAFKNGASQFDINGGTDPVVISLSGASGMAAFKAPTEGASGTLTIGYTPSNTPDTHEATLVISAIGVADVEIKLEGITSEDGATGVENPTISKLYVADGAIHFEALGGELVEVYNSIGQKVYSQTALSGLNSITPNAKGVLLVKVGQDVKKVIF